MNPKQKIEREGILNKAYSDHQKGMGSYSLFKVKNRATSNDLVQDTFIKTWRYLVKGGKIDLMKPFLYHILNHLIIDEYRKRKRISLDALISKGYEPAVEHPERALNIFDGKIAINLIQNLPLKYRRVMQMRYKQDLSIKEIALITGQSKNTVTVQAHRGLEKLKKLYQH